MHQNAFGGSPNPLEELTARRQAPLAGLNGRRRREERGGKEEKGRGGKRGRREVRGREGEAEPQCLKCVDAGVCFWKMRAVLQ